jgi:hypothetical protein
MNKTMLTLLAALTLIGCTKPAEKSSAAGHEFVVETLFTHEGCTVYRFVDVGYHRYFTNCNGATEWRESAGKSTRQVSID